MKMKNIKIYRWIALFLPIYLFSGCSEEFLNRPPESSIVDVNFFKNDDEVLASTALLYNKVWFDYNDKASYNIGDFRAGTAFSAYNDRGNVLFNTTADNGENAASWRAFFITVAQSNMVLENINKYCGPNVTPAIKNYAIAEARFMRALAYRYLVMNWGDVPIIEHNLTLLTDTTIHKNTAKSVWKFITNEMRAVANDLPEMPIKEGRLTKWSAEGMLARFYLTRSGVESENGVRKQEYLDSAKYYADRVIRLSGKSLLSKYENLFKFPYDNNSESLFELQWIFSAAWGTQNSTPAYLNYSNDIANGDGWGGDKSATWWMFKQYNGIQVYGIGPEDTLKATYYGLDQRLHATFMMPGDRYLEITQDITKTDGTKGTQKLIFPATYDAQRSFASIKKYVVGKAQDVNGEATSQHYGHDTYMMRLAEMYLTYAEAELGNQASTTDAKALDYFNMVHTRAGLDPYNKPLVYDTIFKERICEFAMESMAWYDLVSLHYWNPEKAYSILNSQDRGVFAVYPDKMPTADNYNPPTYWYIVKTPWSTTERTINANSGNFLLPIPAVEMTQAPNLRKPAVDYYAQ